jgi:hypothetical protein
MTDENPGAPAEGAQARPPAGAALTKVNAARTFAGVPVTRLMLMGGLAFTAVWGTWASKTIIELRTHQTHIVKARLTEVVSDYVQAAARSGGSPDQVTQATANFLRVLNDAVTAHSADGQIVMLANAIVAGQVPDITDQIRAEVYAKVPRPAAASTNQVQAQMKEFMSSNASPAGGGNGH